MNAYQTAKAEAEARRVARDAALATMPTVHIEEVAAEWRGLDSLSAAEFDKEAK
jgi:hypothetical protein